MSDELDNLKKTLDSLKGEVNAYESISNETMQEINAMRDRINELVLKANDAKTKAWDYSRKLRETEREVKSKEQELEDKNNADEAERKFIALSADLEDVIARAPWKDRALNHQIIGAKRCAFAERAILGDRMGLGKTLTSLMVADMRGVKRLVVITPPDVASNFMREVKKWTDRTAISIVGASKSDRDFLLDTVLPMTEEYVLLVSYSTWRRDISVAEKINKLCPEMVIADEAHYVKSRETKAFKGLREVVSGKNTCINCGAEKPPYVPGMGQVPCCSEPEFENSLKQLLLMTGTPLVNKPQDLFSLLNLLFPDKYRQERDFLDRYCRQDYYTQRWYFREGGLDSLIKQMSSHFVARTREDAGIVIPPQEIIIHEHDFDAEKYPNQAIVIKQLKDKAMLVLNEKDDYGQPMQMPMQFILQLITRQRQALVYPDGIQFKDQQGTLLYSADANGESQKLDIAEDLILELTENGEKDESGIRIGDRVVLFSQFKGTLDALYSRLKSKGIDVVRFNGETSDALRNEIKLDVDRSVTDPAKSKFQVVLAHYRTGGVGLNMTGITNLVVLDEAWNPASRDQAYGRVDRIGQTEETTVHVIRIKKSIDTWLSQLIEDKEALVAGFEKEMNLAAAMLDALIAGDI